MLMQQQRLPYPIPSYFQIYTLHDLTKIIGIIVFHTKSPQLITKVLHLNTVTRKSLNYPASGHLVQSPGTDAYFLGSVMPPYMGALMISYRHYERMHSPTRPEQHQNSFLLATSSGSPSAPLKIIQHSWPIKKHFTSSLQLKSFSPCWVGVNGTQSTSQTFFPMKKKKNLTILFWRRMRIHVHGRTSISDFQRHCSSELLRVYSWNT